MRNLTFSMVIAIMAGCGTTGGGSDLRLEYCTPADRCLKVNASSVMPTETLRATFAEDEQGVTMTYEKTGSEQGEQSQVFDLLRDQTNTLRDAVNKIP